MTFQPFGYHFEVNSIMPPKEAKAALRSGLKGWFEPDNAPRGWIGGPFICLWASAFNQRGPMLIGRISNDGFGTRVRGRAGSDLNGIAWAALLFPLLAYALYRMILDGAATRGQLLLFGGILVIGAPLTFWWAHKDRREAEPLVNFVRRTLGQGLQSQSRRSSSSSNRRLPMRLVVCGDQQDSAPVTAEAVCRAIDTIQYNPNGFIVLALEEERYMQAATEDGGFILEKRDGGEVAHLVAKRLDGTGDRFTVEEITEALLRYLEGQSETPGVRWEHLNP